MTRPSYRFRSGFAITLCLLVVALTAGPAVAQQFVPPGMNIWAEDHDGDGVDDHYFIDLDSDGNVDIAVVDANGDYLPERRWIDGDDNGTFETVQVYSWSELQWVSGGVDVGEDGDVDLVWDDTSDGDGDHDGKVDFDELIPVNEPVAFPQGPEPLDPSGPDGTCTDDCETSLLTPGLPGYLPLEQYVFSQPAATTADGYFSSIGSCGQLSGWTQVGGFGTPALSIGGTTETAASLGSPSFAFMVNNENSMVGMYMGSGGFAPFFLPAGESMMALPTLGGDLGDAKDLDSGTTLIVGRTTDGPGVLFLPTVWQVFGGPGGYEPVPFELPVLSTTLGGSAQAVNNLGMIVGNLGTAGGNQAVLWLGEPGSYDIIEIGQGAAADINDHGVVVGSMNMTDGTTRGFVYENGEVTILRSPLGCFDCSHHAVSINEGGEMVGYVELPSGDTAAVYWPGPEGLPILLSDRVDEEIAAVYEITTADTINDQGQILVAGYLGAQALTFVLTPAWLDNPDTNFDTIPDSCQAGIEPFFRGDLNGDASIDISDPINLLSALFSGGDYPTCEDGADANDDGGLDIADAIFLLSHLFVAGPAPSVVGECGYDTTPDALTCELSSSCSAADVTEAASGLDSEACAGGVLLVEHAYNECIGGIWHTVTDSTYACPDGSYVVVRTGDIDTGQPCP